MPRPRLPATRNSTRPRPAGAPDIDHVFPEAEDFLRFKCDVHAWMFSYVTVVDNPYFAVTGKDGTFKIANVPPGKYTVEAMHRKASGGKPVTKEIEVKDGTTTAGFHPGSAEIAFELSRAAAAR